MNHMSKFEGAAYLPLAIVCIVGFAVLAEPFFSRTFYDESPNNFLAGDTYWHLPIVKKIVETGNYNSEPKELVGFVDEDIPPNEPPLVFYFSAFLANLLGIPAHIAIFFGLLLMLMAAFATVYILLVKYDFRLAAVAAPFFLLSFNFPFIAGINWGLWKAYFSATMFIFSLVLFPAKFRGGTLYLWVLSLTAVILAHISMLPYLLLALLARVLLSEEDRNLRGFLKLAGIVAASIGLSLWYVLNFITRFGVGASTSERVSSLVGGAGYNLFGATPFARHFGYVWELSVLGFLLAVYFALRLRKANDYFFSVFSLFSLLFVVFGVGPSVFGRAYQLRLVWPIVVSIFAGFTIYALIKSVLAVKGRAWPFFAVFLLSFPLLFAFKIISPPDWTYSLTSDEVWSAYRFVAEQTPKNAKVLVIDPTLTQDAIVVHTERYTRYLDSSKFDEMVRDNTGIEEKEKYIFCNIPVNILRGLKWVPTESFASQACAPKKGKACEFDYILAVLQVKREQEIGIMNRFLSSLEKSRFDVVAGGKQAIVIKNREVCKNGA